MDFDENPYPPGTGDIHPIPGGTDHGYPTDLGGLFGLSPIPGEHWLGGRLLGFDPDGNPIYDPLGYGPMADLEHMTISGPGYSGTGGVIAGQTGVFGSLKGHKGDANSTWVF
jgi:hypothetical protein